MAGNDTTRRSIFTNKGEHVLAMLNLSVQAKKIVSQRIPVLMEPFIKVTVSGIDFGRLKIFNAGFATTAKI